MIMLLVYLLLCGYVLVFSGSLFIEAVMKGYYKPSSTEYDYDSFMLGFLYSFPSLLGIFGGLSVLSSKPNRYFRFKVLFFFPSVFWSFLLVLDILRWGMQHWIQWLYLVPALLLCLFIFYGVIKQVPVPYQLAPGGQE